MSAGARLLLGRVGLLLRSAGVLRGVALLTGRRLTGDLAGQGRARDLSRHLLSRHLTLYRLALGRVALLARDLARDLSRHRLTLRRVALSARQRRGVLRGGFWPSEVHSPCCC